MNFTPAAIAASTIRALQLRFVRLNTSRPRAPMGPLAIAFLSDKLMAKLGYDRFFVHGGDWGAHITSLLGLHLPERVLGIHSTGLALADTFPFTKHPIFSSKTFATFANPSFPPTKPGIFVSRSRLILVSRTQRGVLLRMQRRDVLEALTPCRISTTSETLRASFSGAYFLPIPRL